MHHRFKIITIALASILLLSGPTAFAEPYGQGGTSYGECAYGTGCATPAEPSPSPSPATPPAVPPTPAPKPDKPKVDLDINLDVGQVITDDIYTVIVDVSEPPSTTVDIGWVIVYVDEQPIGTVYTPVDNAYIYDWDTVANPGTLLSVVVYGTDSTVLARQDIPVTIRVATVPPAPVAQSTGSTFKEAVANSPTLRFVGVSFPYWLFLLIFALAARLLWLAVRESVNNQRMHRLHQKQALIADEKDNFIALASHYLHTPLTVMRNGADTMSALNEASQTILAPLTVAIEKLRTRIDEILQQVEADTVLSGIKKPELPPATNDRLVTSPMFWPPITLIAILCIASNLLFSVAGELDLGAINLVTQLVVFVVVTGFLLIALRTHRIRRRERAKTQQLLDYQHAIDSARTAFIQQSTMALQEGLSAVEKARANLPQTPSIQFVDEGYRRFADILAKFNLLAQLQAGTDYGAKETFSLKPAVEEIVTSYQPLITSKNLHVKINTHNVNVTQNRQLFNYVLTTVIDNAIKFSSEGGEVSIVADKSSGRLRVAINDTGEGIPAEKLPHLFKPFTRAESAIQFDYEGLGFSLFLDKIIMDYLDGDITAEAAAPHGTRVVVTA